ncbi:hypothetical protein AB0A72_16295 [Streptosporangium roseum]|nr:hypothetical protein [Streptosporangium roseum]
MTTEIDTLATALQVHVDDLLKASPDLGPWRPRIGLAPKLSDAEPVTLAVMSALLGFTSERRRLLRQSLPLFPGVAAALVVHAGRAAGGVSGEAADGLGEVGRAGQVQGADGEVG